jgi:hypothetical protein
MIIRVDASYKIRIVLDLTESGILESLFRIALCAQAAHRSADGVAAACRKLFHPLYCSQSSISTVCVCVRTCVRAGFCLFRIEFSGPSE